MDQNIWKTRGILIRGIGYVAHFASHIQFYICKVLEYLEFLCGYHLAALLF